MTEHQFGGLDVDEEGWDISRCDCGWESPPCPDTDTACGFWGDHLTWAVQQEEDGDGR